MNPESPTLPNLIYEPAQANAWPPLLDPQDWTVSRALDRIVEAGGICAKAFIEPGFGGAFNWPAPGGDTLTALRRETRDRGLALIIHANSVDAWRAALEAQPDIIAHGLWYWPGGIRDPAPPTEVREVIEAAANAGVAVQPTLQVLHGQQSIFDLRIMDDPRFAEAMPGTIVAYLRSESGQTALRAVAAQYEQAAPDVAELTAIFAERTRLALSIMVSNGVHLIFGSDTPSGDGIGNPPGFNGRLELQRWADAGVPLPRILGAATLDNARALGLQGEIGSVQVGKQADLLLLGANPLEDVAAYDTIEVVFLAGQPIARELLSAHNAN
jgi:imidazolonepropionase-like amidohydrolase